MSLVDPTVMEWLQNPDTVDFAASDGATGSLDVQQTIQNVGEALGVDINMDQIAGLFGSFNCCSAGTTQFDQTADAGQTQDADYTVDRTADNVMNHTM